MSNWHVLDRPNGNFRIIYHIAIPAANNSAGVPYRTAIINSGLGGKTILPDGDGSSGTISAAEKATILSGAVVEQIVQWDPTAGGTVTGQAIIDSINANFSANSADLLTGFQARLQHFGRSG